MKRTHVLWGLAAIFMLGMIGCLEIPLGDPETSKADDQYIGLWLNSATPNDESELLAVMKYDSRTYLISEMKFVKTDAGYQSRGQTNMKAWLTRIGDTTFITAEPKDPKSLIESSDKAYFVAKIARAGDQVTVQQVDEKFVKEANVTTPAALAKLIADNLANPKLLEADTGTYTRMGPGDSDKAKSILNAFAEPKQQNASAAVGDGVGL
jgi:hypothetical protein